VPVTVLPVQHAIVKVEAANIHILGRSDVAVVSDGMPANQEVFNAVVVETLEEIAKVGAQRFGVHS
jgi:uncharacterized membrane protein YqiK